MKKIFGEIDLTIGSVFKNLILFTLPFFISYFLNSLYSAIDLFFVGQYSDTINSAAVSSGTTITFAINSIIAGLTTGGTVIIAKHFGAKSEKIGNVTKTFIIYFSLIAILLLILMLALFYPIVSWMKIDGEEAQNTTRMYLLILTIAIPFYVGYLGICAILRGLGNSFIPFIVLLIGVASNIGLDAIFVIVFQMGAIGAAIATAIGEIIAFLVALSFLLIRKLPYKINFDFKLDKNYAIDILKSGLPIAIQDGLVVISFAIILAAVSTRGIDYTSAVGITDRVTSFGFVPLSAIGASISTATAQNMGANKIDRVKKYMHYGLLISIVLGGILGALCQLFPRQLASIFAGNQPEALEIAIPYIKSTSLDIFVCIFVFPINAIFIGSGHSVFAMSQNLLATFLVRIPVAIIFAIVLNESMYVVGLAYCISTTISLILVLIYYLSKRWMKPFSFKRKRQI